MKRRLFARYLKIKFKFIKLLTTTFRQLKSLFISNRILVLGDSHALVFYHWLFDLHFPHHIFEICAVNGATVSGLENPNSKTQARPIFERTIQKHLANTYILLLGEVDTGFVIWYRAQKYQTSPEEMLNLAIENYKHLIQYLRSRGNVIVISAPLPTIPDQNPCGEIANLRKEIKATQHERTQLTLAFNRRVAQICASAGAHFVDLDSSSLGENGLVKKELLNPDPCDHHYNLSVHARLLIEKLRPLLEKNE